MMPLPEVPRVALFCVELDLVFIHAVFVPLMYFRGGARRSGGENSRELRGLPPLRDELRGLPPLRDELRGLPPLRDDVRAGPGGSSLRTVEGRLFGDTSRPWESACRISFNFLDRCLKRMLASYVSDFLRAST